MKNLIVSILTLLAFSNAAMSQKSIAKKSSLKTESAKVIVMVNTAKWCPVCMVNGKRVEENVISQLLKNDKCEVIVNDLTDDQTKAKSNEKCEKSGISDIALNNKGTGMIYFINSATKEVISKVSVSQTDSEILKEFEMAISKI